MSQILQASRPPVGAYLSLKFAPGDGLLQTIATSRGTWASFHALDGLKVPALENSAEWTRHRMNPCAFLKPEVVKYIDTGHPIVAEELLRARLGSKTREPHAFTQLRNLTAAVWLDVGAAAVDDLRARLRPDLASIHDQRQGNKAVYRYAREGRTLWVKLGAWPWWAIAAAWADDGESPPPTNWERLPEEWWRLPRVLACFEAWRTASHRPLHEHDRRAREAA